MKKLTALLIALMCFLISSYAQEVVSVKVTDSSGTPLQGASVREKGTKNGVATAANGSFTLRVKPGATLVISDVGYEAREVPASANVTIALQSNVSNLTEVVVTALGIRREKRQLTYSTQEVAGETVVQARQDNLVNSLAGKVSGVQVTNSSGMAGSSARITIRGNVSL